MNHLTTTDPNTDCSGGASSSVKIALGVVLIVGIQLSYIPQHLNIIQAKSSLGINPLTFLLSNVGAYCNFVAGLLVELSTIQCCGHVSFAQCNIDLLSLYQLAVGFVNNVVMYGLMLTYFTPNPDLSPQKQIWERGIAFYGYLVYMGLLIGCGGSVVLWMLISQQPFEVRSDFASGWSVLSVICNLSTWMPQIWQTYRMKSSGVLSIGMLLLQTPGSFAVIVFQVMEGHGYQTWVPYIATGTQQTILTSLCLYYRWQERKRAGSMTELEPTTAEDNESTRGLLRSSPAPSDDDEGEEEKGLY